MHRKANGHRTAAGQKGFVSCPGGWLFKCQKVQIRDTGDPRPGSLPGNPGAGIFPNASAWVQGRNRQHRTMIKPGQRNRVAGGQFVRLGDPHRGGNRAFPGNQKTDKLQPSRLLTPGASQRGGWTLLRKIEISKAIWLWPMKISGFLTFRNNSTSLPSRGIDGFLFFRGCFSGMDSFYPSD